MAILDDLRSAVRALRAHAGLTLTIAVILAIAIGANAAVFALVDVTLLAPLPFPDGSRLVTVNQTRADSAREPLSIADYRICATATAPSRAWGSRFNGAPISPAERPSASRG